MKTQGRRQTANLRDLRDPVEKAKFDMQQLNRDTFFRDDQTNQSVAAGRQTQDAIRNEVTPQYSTRRQVETGYPAGDMASGRRIQKRIRKEVTPGFE